MMLTFPGFFDLQVNGFGGVDFNTPNCSTEQIAQAVAAMRSTGVTRYLPTFITSRFEHFSACCKPFVNDRSPENEGFHMEGPYINPNDGPRGAHPRDAVIDASIDDFRRRQEAAGGRIKLVTLAPEVPGAIPLIQYLAEHQIAVAIGHSDATAQQIREAVAAGATLSTHLGNGSARMLPKHDNLIMEQLAADRLCATFIVDGHHLPAASVKVMVRAKTPLRSLLVTDAVAPAGCAPGRYTLGTEMIELVETGRVSQPGKWHLAGSALKMNDAVANTVKFTGLPIEDVLPMASTRAALAVGCKTAGTVTATWDSQHHKLTIESVVN
jgi:N-acetylglucosamine-6-phosphate deacetylase